MEFHGLHKARAITDSVASLCVVHCRNVVIVKPNGFSLIENVLCNAYVLSLQSFDSVEADVTQHLNQRTDDLTVHGIVEDLSLRAGLLFDLCLDQPKGSQGDQRVYHRSSATVAQTYYGRQ